MQHWSFSFQAGDIVLCELDVEKKETKVQAKRKLGQQYVHYVARVEEVLEDGHITVLFTRCKSVAIKDSFEYPDKRDVTTLVRSRVLGVLSVKEGETARQANRIKVYPALNSFNIR